MDFIFYVAAIISILASIKAVTSTQSIKALIYFVVSLLSSAVIFCLMGAYFSAALIVILFIGVISLLFLSVLSFMNIRKDIVEQSHLGINPKIWLGPLILVFILFVALLYNIVSTDYAILPIEQSNENSSITDTLLNTYILAIELGILLLLGGIVIAYHFIHRICAEYSAISAKNDKDTPSNVNKD